MDIQDITLEYIPSNLICPYCRQLIINKNLLYHPIFGNNLIKVAIHYGNMQVCIEILNFIDDIYTLNTHTLPLHTIVKPHQKFNQDEKFIHMATALIRKNIDINSKNDKGKTPLHIAVKKGDLPMLTVLINHNININTQDQFGCTPLHYAVKYKINETINLLIEKKANINVKDDFEWISLHYAITHRKKNIIKP